MGSLDFDREGLFSIMDAASTAGGFHGERSLEVRGGHWVEGRQIPLDRVQKQNNKNSIKDSLYLRIDSYRCLSENIES